MGLFDTIKDLKNTATTVINTGRNSLQDAARTTGRLANRASNMNLSDIGHTALDVAGFIPVVGAAADVANAGWYAAKGDWKNASLSAAAAVPGVGDAAAAVKIGVKATSAVAGAGAVSKVAKAGTRGKTYLTYTLKDKDGGVRYVGRASGRGTPEQVMSGRISRGHNIVKQNPHLRPQIDAVQGNRAANRGAEDVLYSRHQVRNPQPVSGRTLAGGANRNGRQLLNETNTQSNKPWKARTVGRRNIEAYARDLRGLRAI